MLQKGGSWVAEVSRAEEGPVVACVTGVSAVY